MTMAMGNRKESIDMKIKIKANNPERSIRDSIAAMQKILDATEEKFEEYIDMDTIKLTVGADEVDLYFGPRTWEAAEEFLMFCICHYIESEGLEKYPMYDEMLTRYAHALNTERGNFD